MHVIGDNTGTCCRTICK